jgi:hypothetical protein
MLPKFAYRRLLKKGTQGEAEIVRAESVLGGVGRVAATKGWNVTLQVKFDDGSTAEVERYLKNEEISSFSKASRAARRAGADRWPELEAGGTLPIRYDPKDHSRVEIDTRAVWPWKGPREGDRLQREGEESIEEARRLWRELLKQGRVTQAQFDEQMHKLDLAERG